MNPWYYRSISVAWIFGIFYGETVFRHADEIPFYQLVTYATLAGILLTMLTIITFNKTRKR